MIHIQELVNKFNQLKLNEQVYLLDLLQESFVLQEGIKSAREKYMNEIGEDNFNELISIDPSKNKKYLDWICKQYVDGYMFPDIQKFVNKFDVLANKNLLTNKDIYSYATLSDLRKDIEGLSTTATKSEQKKEKRAGANLVFNNNKGVSVYNITTPEASDMYGKGTKWCTTGKGSEFSLYYRIGLAFYYIINNNYKDRSPLSKLAITLYNKQKMKEEGEYSKEKIDAYRNIVIETDDSLMELYTADNKNMTVKLFYEYLDKWGIPFDIFKPRDYFKLSAEDRETAKADAERIKARGGYNFAIEDRPLEYFNKDLKKEIG